MGSNRIVTNPYSETVCETKWIKAKYWGRVGPGRRLSRGKRRSPPGEVGIPG